MRRPILIAFMLLLGGILMPLKADSQSDKARAQEILGRMASFYNRGEADSIKAFFQNDMDKLRHLGQWNEYYEVWTFYINSLIYYSNSKNQALREVQLMFADAMERKETYGQGIAYYTMGNVYLNMNNLDQSADAYEKGLQQLLQLSPLPIYTSEVFSYLGDVLNEQHKYDKLTGHLSREGFIEEADALFQTQTPSDYAVAVFDIYNFKAINDIFGIDGGDQLLRFVLEKINDSFLAPEISARLESDWFVFLIRRDHFKWEDLDELLKIKYVYHGRTIHLQLRCGIYFVEAPFASASQMVEWSITAKQNVDRDSRHQYTFYEPQMSFDQISEAQMLIDLKKSIKEHHFKMVSVKRTAP